MLTIIGVASTFVILAVLIKYKPVYKVTISGEEIGYIKNKDNIENAIKEYENNKEGNIAYIDIGERPNYELKFVSHSQSTNEQELLNKVQNNSVITYKFYAIVVDGENKQYVNTIEEAETVVAQIKQEYEDKIELNIGVSEVYTEDINIQASGVEIAKTNIQSDVDKKVEIKSHSVNGIYLSKPITGIITSRYAERSSIRSSAHTGLDIAAPAGTPIYPCAEGTVTYAESKGSYGNLVKVSHGNGVETWYAHCSKIYVSIGQKVTTNTKIAAVGSTGNSTGNHLHLEIRVDGVTKNPQNYLYK